MIMAKILNLTQGKYAIVDDDDYENLSQWKWSARKTKRPDVFYAMRKQNNKGIQLHRFIMRVNDPRVTIDHKDGDGLNNCKSNLRICTRSENGANRRGKNNNAKPPSSKYLGVKASPPTYKKRWQAVVTKNYKKYFVGFFHSEIEAAKERDKKAVELFGEFASLNFPIT